MRSAIACFALSFLAACASAGGPSPDAGGYVPAEGTFAFSANIPGALAQGSLLVTADTFFLRDSRSCGLMESTPAEIRLACRGGSAVVNLSNSQSQTIAILTFRRQSSNLGGSWTMSVPVARQREVCERTQVRNGREYCVSRKRETYTAYEKKSGSVQVRRVPQERW